MQDYAALRNEQGQTLQEFLEQYNPNKYPHPSSTVDMAVLTVAENKLKLLLIKRRNHPFLGCWATPGGFVNFDEDLDAAALRELKEETGLQDGIFFKQLYTFGRADRDPRTRVITTAYLTLAPAEVIQQAEAGDDAADAKWFDVTKTVEQEDDTQRVSLLTLHCEETGEIMQYRITKKVMGNWTQTSSELVESASSCQLAGDHIKIVNMAIEEVQRHAASTGILFNLLPQEFTLNELKKVYESIIGKKVDSSNFRRDVKKLVKPTGHTKRYWGYDTALYTANKMYESLDF